MAEQSPVHHRRGFDLYWYSTGRQTGGGDIQGARVAGRNHVGTEPTQTGSDFVAANGGGGTTLLSKAAFDVQSIQFLSPIAEGLSPLDPGPEVIPFGFVQASSGQGIGGRKVVHGLGQGQGDRRPQRRRQLVEQTVMLQRRPEDRTRRGNNSGTHIHPRTSALEPSWLSSCLNSIVQCRAVRRHMRAWVLRRGMNHAITVAAQAGCGGAGRCERTLICHGSEQAGCPCGW